MQQNAYDLFCVSVPPIPIISLSSRPRNNRSLGLPHSKCISSLISGSLYRKAVTWPKSLALTSVLQLLSPQCWFPPVRTCCLQTLGRGTFVGTDIMESSDHREGMSLGARTRLDPSRSWAKGLLLLSAMLFQVPEVDVLVPSEPTSYLRDPNGQNQLWSMYLLCLPV